MNKKTISLTIDNDLWFYFRSRDINVSDLVNTFLKSNIDVEQNENLEEDKMLEDITLMSKKINLERKERDELVYKLKLLQEKNKTAQKEHLDNIIMVGKSLNNTNLLRDL